MENKKTSHCSTLINRWEKGRVLYMTDYLNPQLWDQGMICYTKLSLRTTPMQILINGHRQAKMS
jgi:hypothetical protein